MAYHSVGLLKALRFRHTVVEAVVEGDMRCFSQFLIALVSR